MSRTTIYSLFVISDGTRASTTVKASTPETMRPWERLNHVKPVSGNQQQPPSSQNILEARIRVKQILLDFTRMAGNDPSHVLQMYHVRKKYIVHTTAELRRSRQVDA